MAERKFVVVVEIEEIYDDEFEYNDAKALCKETLTRFSRGFATYRPIGFKIIREIKGVQQKC